MKANTQLRTYIPGKITVAYTWYCFQYYVGIQQIQSTILKKQKTVGILLLFNMRVILLKELDGKQQKSF